MEFGATPIFGKEAFWPTLARVATDRTGRPMDQSNLVGSHEWVVMAFEGGVREKRRNL
jgi:hypothetical protein